ncbi:hypothetical protein BDZ97DRAFT_1757492 [Flammula alnicola]|nr:hypothetical protein BDZ97DRAFT_1757492 [Flammula alnicola]
MVQFNANQNFARNEAACRGLNKEPFPVTQWRIAGVSQQIVADEMMDETGRTFPDWQGLPKRFRKLLSRHIVLALLMSKHFTVHREANAHPTQQSIIILLITYLRQPELMTKASLPPPSIPEAHNALPCFAQLPNSVPHWNFNPSNTCPPVPGARMSASHCYQLTLLKFPCQCAGADVRGSGLIFTKAGQPPMHNNQFNALFHQMHNEYEWYDFGTGPQRPGLPVIPLSIPDEPPAVIAYDGKVNLTVSLVAVWTWNCLHSEPVVLPFFCRGYTPKPVT